uniref:Protein kinase domain-containing protein n=1 Tax=Entomoneis paludosa TaxID=265537 RepID=A0A7S2Y450_9STRA|mmetsp:Transcript_15141/g.31216  ORF Transcript_15141/g.31216 Transcript_15141/m.31216 type:complete len:441 (+) Transcript_15141:109-1431(+)
MSTTATTTMEELTQRMEGIQHDDNTSEQPRPLVTPQETDQRPWDYWVAAGAPSNPIDFPQPRIHRGRRVEVVCYIPATGGHERLANVLLSDEPRKAGVRELAYYPIPHKKPIKTIMGHVEICVVLKRCQKDEDTSLEEDDDEEVFVVEEDEDVVFELTEEYVAVKVNFDRKMQSLRNRHAEDPMKEIAAMQLIGAKSPHVMGCRDVLYDAGTQTLNVVLRYCPHGDLFQMLQDFQNNSGETPGLTEPQARYWFKQILLGLRHLRDLGICHRDLSPENVMMDHNQCLVIDLGMCLRVPYTDAQTGGTTDISRGSHKRLFSPQGACGKLPYMSPEIYKNRKPFDGELADVWTAGTILFCMVTGNRSYARPHASDPQFYWMTQGLQQMLRDWSVPISPEGLHLLQNLLQVNPRLRLTLDEALSHPWFDGPSEEMDLSDPMLSL